MSDIDCDFINKLIENVQKKKCLYDKRDAFYFNRTYKERAWKDVADICNRSVTDCKYRWKLLRERLLKELKKKEAPSGSGMCYVEEWKFFQPMIFLKDYLAPRRTRDNVEDDVEDSTLPAESFLEVTCSPTPAKRKVNLECLRVKLNETLEGSEKSLAAPVEQESSDQVCMKTILHLMKDLPEEVKDTLQANFLQEVYRCRHEWRKNV